MPSEKSDVWSIQQFADFSRQVSHLQKCDIVPSPVRSSMCKGFKEWNGKWHSKVEWLKASGKDFISACTWLWGLQDSGTAQGISADTACYQSVAC